MHRPFALSAAAAASAQIVPNMYMVYLMQSGDQSISRDAMQHVSSPPPLLFCRPCASPAYSSPNH